MFKTQKELLQEDWIVLRLAKDPKTTNSQELNRDEEPALELMELN